MIGLGDFRASGLAIVITITHTSVLFYVLFPTFFSVFRKVLFLVYLFRV